MNLKYLSFVPLLLIGVTGCDTSFNSGLTDQEIVDEVASKSANAQTAQTYQTSGGQKSIKGLLIEESETENNRPQFMLIHGSFLTLKNQIEK